MFDATTPTSELEAVNLMLSLIGENPVSSLGAAPTDPDVQNALMILRAETRALQSRQWTFNFNEAVEMAPNGSGFILLPDNASRAVPHVSANRPTMADVKTTVRGDSGVMKIYDRTANSFVWTSTLYMDVTYRYAFENLPEPARWYLWVTAGRKFQGRFDTSELRYKLSAQDELEARAGLAEYEIDDSNANFLLDSDDVLAGWAYR